MNSSFAMPLCEPERFHDLWERIREALPTGGRFSGQWYGPRDSWVGRPGHDLRRPRRGDWPCSTASSSRCSRRRKPTASRRAAMPSTGTSSISLRGNFRLGRGPRGGAGSKRSADAGATQLRAAMSRFRASDCRGAHRTHASTASIWSASRIAIGVLPVRTMIDFRTPLFRH